MTRKHYGWAITDHRGEPDEFVYFDREEAVDTAGEWQQDAPNQAPHRVVELFYEVEEDQA